MQNRWARWWYVAMMTLGTAALVYGVFFSGLSSAARVLNFIMWALFLAFVITMKKRDERRVHA